MPPVANSRSRSRWRSRRCRAAMSKFKWFTAAIAALFAASFGKWTAQSFLITAKSNWVSLDILASLIYAAGEGAARGGRGATSGFQLTPLAVALLQLHAQTQRHLCVPQLRETVSMFVWNGSPSARFLYTSPFARLLSLLLRRLPTSLPSLASLPTSLEVTVLMWSQSINN